MNLTRSGLLGKLFGPPPGTPDSYVATARASKSDGYGWEAAAGGAPTGAAGGDLGGTYPNPTVAKALAALTDVTLTSPQEGDLLRYTGGKWRNAAGALVKVLPATWSPADVTQDETDAAVLVLPAPCLLLGAYWRRVTPTDAGSTPTLEITDDHGLFDSFAFALASDTTTLFGAATVAFSFAGQGYTGSVPNAWGGGLSLYAPLSFTFAYVAGITPGATKPVFELVFAYLPIA